MSNLRAISAMKDITRTHKPDIIFLCETLVHERKVHELKVKLGYGNCLCVDREGMSGGLAMLWKESLDVQVMSYARNFINLEVNEEGIGRWRLTGFYGFPDNSRRRDSWDLLRSLAGLSDLPWCIIGDFNDILDMDEKIGRVERPQWFIDGFRNAVLDCELSDISLDGYQFTWSHRLDSDVAVEERLDRAMVTPAWWSLFPDARLQNLMAPISDHNPILLSTVAAGIHVFQRKKI